MFAQTVTRALSRLGLDQRGIDPFPRQPAPMLPGRAEETVRQCRFVGFPNDYLASVTV